MNQFEYLVCDESGHILFAYDNEEDALERAFSHDEWSVSRQPIEEQPTDE